MIGLPAAGKSSFCRSRFFESHIVLSLDVVKTRYRESVLFEACLAAKQAVVIDNTNVSIAERARYIVPAQERGFAVKGYYFRSVVEECLQRNASRERAVPERGVLGRAAALELPRLAEGFESLHYVRLADGRFLVEDWKE